MRDGAELEHALMLQYLYAAFSVKQPEYARLAGWPSHRYGGRPLHLLGVAIEEMSSTTLVLPEQTAELDSTGNIIVRSGSTAQAREAA